MNKAIVDIRLRHRSSGAAPWWVTLSLDTTCIVCANHVKTWRHPQTGST